MISDMKSLSEKTSKLFACFPDVSDEEINIGTVKQMEKNISEMSHYLSQISELHSNVANNLRKMREKYENCIKKMDNFVVSRAATPEQSANIGNYPSSAQQHEKNRRNKNKLSYVEAAKNHSPECSVSISPGISLDARQLDKWEELADIPGGILHYNKQFNQFAVKIDDTVYYGNIGNIFHLGKNPKSTKNCKFGKKCDNINCQYYHDPIIYDSSSKIGPEMNTVRNYIVPNFLYSSGFVGKCDRRHRHFGSLANIPMDLLLYPPDELQRLKSQIMHDILCSLLLLKYAKNIH